ncbi:MAG: AzlC family ABC transporter permease [Lachnospiraceae bacterium]|nr:AzlC family ABC transporter permease [Lachnospiraceae bacterium]
MKYRNDYSEGFRNGIPIALGYFFVSFTFGIMGSLSGLLWWETVLISMTNLTSAGQFAGVKIIAAGGSLPELAISQFIINLRYSLMGISLSQNTDENFGTGARAALGFGITDEIYAVAVNRKTPVSRSFFLGLMTLPYLGWSLGTLAGALFGDVMPSVISDAMGIAIYGMFIAILIPGMKGDRHIAMISALAVLISCVLTYVPALSGISVGFAVIICAVTASLIGAAFFPVSAPGDEEVAS